MGEVHVGTVLWEADAVTNSKVFAIGHHQRCAEDPSDEGTLCVEFSILVVISPSLAYINGCFRSLMNVVVCIR